MSPNENIYGALNARLISVLQGIPEVYADIPIPVIQWENVVIETPPAELFLEVYLLPAQRRKTNIGNPIKYEYRGIYQITIIGVKGKGSGDAYTIAGILEEGFKPPQTLEQNNQEVGIRDINIATDINTGTNRDRVAGQTPSYDYYKLIVSIEYYSYY